MATAAEQAAQARVAESDKIVAQERADYHERIKGKPTPTQKECDLIKAGAPPAEKESDGAGPEVRYGFKQLEASSPSGGGSTYSTRATRAAPPTRSTSE